jgi:hypothetical protein
MNELKLTPIDQIEDMADGVPVLAVEGTVKFAQEVKNGTSAAGHAWSKQFFVLTNGTAEIACSMWDAEGNELPKGETVHIENTQNKKGVWSGMIKGSYQKNGERKHTLEIRAEQVKIHTGTRTAKTANIPKTEQVGDKLALLGAARAKELETDPDWPEAPATAPELPLPIPKVKSSSNALDERQRAIIRQHSQSMALEVLKLKVTLNELTVEDLTPSKLKTLADYFDNDVIEAAQ